MEQNNLLKERVNEKNGGDSGTHFSVLKYFFGFSMSMTVSRPNVFSNNVYSTICRWLHNSPTFTHDGHQREPSCSLQRLRPRQSTMLPSAAVVATAGSIILGGEQLAVSSSTLTKALSPKYGRDGPCRDSGHFLPKAEWAQGTSSKLSSMDVGVRSMSAFIV